MLCISGCATNGSVIDTACAWVRPIMVSRDDVLTDETARSILIHNETWERVCSQPSGSRLDGLIQPNAQLSAPMIQLPSSASERLGHDW